jgi:hypothetical protein
MGLVSPLATGAHLVALCADEQTAVAQQATTLAGAVHKRHPSVLPLRIVDGVRLAHAAATRRLEPSAAAVPPRARGTLFANVRAVDPSSHESRWASIYTMLRTSRRQVSLACQLLFDR